jgi:prepilin-type N-terminal cleavage/methylation domain-containing protein
MKQDAKNRPRPGFRPIGEAGFTLVEMAVVLVIVGLLMASLLLPLGAQLEQRQISDTRARLEDAREALIAFAIVNGRLPCPATTTSAGLEAPVAPVNGVCTNPWGGFLPARTLSFNPQSPDGYAIDAWNNPIRYAISNASSSLFTSPPATGIKSVVQASGFGDSSLQPDLRVCSDAIGSTSTACAAGKDVTSAASVVAIVYSVGKNFASVGATGIDEAANWNPNPADPTKLTTLSSDRVFVSHTPTPAGAPGGEFDDIVLWIPVATLFSRMIAAGTLP